MSDILTQPMYAVEHAYPDGRKTYDIFPTQEEADAYCGNAANWTETHKPLFMFRADFNADLIYFDEQLNGWNYEDFADTIIGNYTIIQIYNAA